MATLLPSFRSGPLGSTKIPLGQASGSGLGSGWALRDVGAKLGTYQVGARFEALIEDVLLVPLQSRYTQVGFNLISVQVWRGKGLSKDMIRY